MEPTEPAVAFVFQSHPDRWDLRRYFQPGVTGEWSVNQHRKQMHPGQLVLLWEAKGSQKVEVRGLYGWGITTSEVKKGLHGGPTIQVQYIERWVHPEDAAQNTPETDHIAPIQAPDVLKLQSWTRHRLALMPIGTNFTVNSNQLSELTEKVVMSRIPDSQFPEVADTAKSQTPLEPSKFKSRNITLAPDRLQHPLRRHLPTGIINKVGLSSIADRLWHLPGLQSPPRMGDSLQEAPVLLSDRWADVDRFGFEKLAKEIARSIVLADQLTVAVYGKWGSGKTTLLRFIKNELSSEKYNWAVTWFDLWEHQHEASILAALLDHVAETVGKSRIAKDIKALALSALACAKLSTPGFSVSGAAFLNAMEQYRRKSRPVRDELASCVNKWSETRRKQNSASHIAIFVDNIERCSAEVVGRFLQEVNVLFDFPGVTYLLAAEREQLERTISQFYVTSGRAFLEKFIQAEFTVPRIEDYLLAKWITEEYPDLTEDQAELVTKSVESNPRAIKRTLNNLSINRITVSEKFREEMDLILASTLLFDHSPDIWKKLTETKRPVRKRKSKGIRSEGNPQGMRPIPDGADDTNIKILNSDGGYLMRGLSDYDMQQFALLTRDTVFAMRAREALAKETAQRTQIAEKKRSDTPNDVDAILNLADIYASEDKPEEATELYKQALEVSMEKGNKARVHLRLATVLSDMNNEKEAKQHAEKAADLGEWHDPEDATILASELFELDSTKKAFDVCDSALKKWPNNLGLLDLRALILAARGQGEEALADCDRMLDIEPSYRMAYINRGTILYSMDRQEEAVASYEKALEYWPYDPDTLILLGNALYYLGRYDDELEKYEQALEIQPDNPHALYGKAYLLSRKGKLDDAYKTLETAFSVGFSDFEHAESDEDLDPLRKDPEYRSKFEDLLSRYRK